MLESSVFSEPQFAGPENGAIVARGGSSARGGGVLLVFKSIF